LVVKPCDKGNTVTHDIYIFLFTSGRSYEHAQFLVRKRDTSGTPSVVFDGQYIILWYNFYNQFTRFSLGIQTV
jgi:hypothetical protein